MVDFRKSRPHPPFYSNGICVERASALKFLGLHLNGDLTWRTDTATLIKKTQQRFHFLHSLAKELLVSVDTLHPCVVCQLHCSGKDSSTEEVLIAEQFFIIIMQQVKNFSVEYNPIDKNNVFTSGDYIAGRITFDVTQDCKIGSLWIKMKGKANVKWTEHYGKTVVVYHNKEKYFSIKTFVIQDGEGNNIVTQGCHMYPFTFQIPQQDLPSSFKGSWGKIKYTLEANLSRSMRLDSKAKTHFTVVHKGSRDPAFMVPQRSIIDKKMNLFSSGTVSMEVTIAKTCFLQGEGMKVVAYIQNRSSRGVRPKYCLYKKYSYFAKSKRRVETKNILKEVGESIPPFTGHTVIRFITIPLATCASIFNCNIIKAEYRLKVYLDVKYASDPEIKFPVIILPALQGSDEEHLPTNPEFEANSKMGATYFMQEPTASLPRF
ncbi:arrestin domain-containing protein 3-like [Dunckerocampus dactyliophorus]|uniref:arrestin domain-containing protein 3-like n=1 Tax=Dunckerocampus dactyliophorus TaxID=161453 RepID=UPI00240666AA|nr:arrestin domain-containing protein 3-like [Dunckerocampus dactyliophorus]